MKKIHKSFIMKKIHKSFNKYIDGICSGFAEYLEVDPNIVRLLYILFGLFFPITAIIFYIVMMLTMPDWNE